MDTPLRRARVHADLTQDQLSALAKVNKRVISNAERGLRISPLSEGRIARALHADIDALFPEREAVS